ncbi:protein kinase domain-containing protein [Archangium lipolyticum]|uniref:protein kinase domain-containing protein n=1 Tax=Archangium lipolyticum TaxID=2970465 RepID=UPI00214B2567|nr:hypothetical protein [Archangium lipolyticum]
MRLQLLRFFEGRCAGLMLTLARTLGAVHRKNVLHRNVKRDNILIRSRNGEFVLVDFGIGNVLEATTLLGAGLLPPGTQEYVSPEAWRFLGENVGEPVTYKSRVSDELWALGRHVLLAPHQPAAVWHSA